MARGRGDIRTRIDLDGDAEVRRKLDQIGAAGERALGDIGRSARVAGGGLAAFGDTAKKINRDIAEPIRGFGTLRARFDDFGKSVSTFGTVVVPSLRGAFAAIGISGIAAGLKGAVSDTASSLTELRNVAKATGFAPIDVKVFSEAIEGTGETADFAGQSLTRYADKIGELRLKAKGAGTAISDAARQVVTMKGALVDGVNPAEAFTRVFRGGEAKEAITSIQDPLKILGVNIRAFSEDAAGARSLLIAIAKGLAELRQRDAALATAAGVELFGRQFVRLAEALDRLAETGSWEEIERGLRETGREPSAEALARLKDYEAALDALGDKIEEIKQKIGIAAFPALTAGLNALLAAPAAIAGLPAQLNEIGASIGGPIGTAVSLVGDNLRVVLDLLTFNFTAAWADWQTFALNSISAVGDALKFFGELSIAGFSAVFDHLRESAASAFGWVSARIRDIGGLVSSLVDRMRDVGAAVGSVLGSIPMIPGFASGGLVSGPGTGTSDSVVARLSAGEYVLRAAAVDKLGVSFLDALNGLSMPLVPRTRFASGGLVMAGSGSGGAPVHLHLGGRSFALTGAPKVVDELTREARRAQLLSAGVTPSWG